MSESEVQRRIAALDLRPHPEGGYYRETYRSPEQLPVEALPARYAGSRSFCTAILYLLPRGEFSAWHRLRSDELWHFHDGCPLLLHSLAPDGQLVTVLLGTSSEYSEVPQACVPAGWWFAAEPSDQGAYSLVGATVAPGFEFDDFELAERTTLTAQFPQHVELIRKLTREA